MAFALSSQSDLNLHTLLHIYENAKEKCIKANGIILVTVKEIVFQSILIQMNAFAMTNKDSEMEYMKDVSFANNICNEIKKILKQRGSQEFSFSIKNFDESMRWYHGGTFFLNKMLEAKDLDISVGSIALGEQQKIPCDFVQAKNPLSNLSLCDIFGGFAGNNKISKAFLTTFTGLEEKNEYINFYFKPRTPLIIAGHDLSIPLSERKNYSTTSNNRIVLPRMHYWPELQFIYPQMPVAFQGCMHPKVWLLFYPDRLRIVISSVNLENTEWSRSSFSYFFNNYETKTFALIQASCHQFTSGLLAFIGRLTKGLPQCSWVIESILQYDLTSAKSYFVSSLPGVHSSIPYPIPHIPSSLQSPYCNGKFISNSSTNFECAILSCLNETDLVSPLRLDKLQNARSKCSSFLCVLPTSVFELDQVIDIDGPIEFIQAEKPAEILRSLMDDPNLSSRKIYTKIDCVSKKIQLFVFKNEELIECGRISNDLCDFLIPLLKLNIIDISSANLFLVPNRDVYSSFTSTLVAPLIDLIVHKGKNFSPDFSLWDENINQCFLRMLSCRHVGRGFVDLESILRDSNATEFQDSEEVAFAYYSSSVGNSNDSWYCWLDVITGRNRNPLTLNKHPYGSISQPMSVVFPRVADAFVSRGGSIESYVSKVSVKPLICKFPNIKSFCWPDGRYLARPLISSHSKIFARIFLSKSTNSYYGWTYIGSHNCSENAWGKHFGAAEKRAVLHQKLKQKYSYIPPVLAVKRSFSDMEQLGIKVSEADYEEKIKSIEAKLNSKILSDLNKQIIISNYEAGVVFVCPPEIKNRVISPFITNANCLDFINCSTSKISEGDVNKIQTFPFTFRIPLQRYSELDVPFSGSALNQLDPKPDYNFCNLREENENFLLNLEEFMFAVPC